MMSQAAGRVTRLNEYKSKLGSFLWPEDDFHSRKSSSLMGELQHKRSESLEYNFNTIRDALKSFEPDYVVFSTEGWEEHNRLNWKEVVRPSMLKRLQTHFDLNERKQVFDSVTKLLDELIVAGCTVEGYETILLECDLMVWQDYISIVSMIGRPKGIRILRPSDLSPEDLIEVSQAAGLNHWQAEKLVGSFAETN
jgi:hypothetical protein